MALIQCSECGKDVSTQAKTCPSCGAKVQLPIPPKPPKRPTSPVIKFSLIAAVLGTFSLLWLNGKDNREARGAEEKRVASLTPAERAADTLLKEKAAAKTYSAAQTAKTEKEAADKLARAARDKDKVQEDFAFKHAAQMMPKLVAGLLDPESAKIKGVYIDSTGDLLCVQLLSKNAYGAYTGEQTFAVSWRLGRVKNAACYTKAYIDHSYRFKSLEKASVYNE